MKLLVAFVIVAASSGASSSTVVGVLRSLRDDLITTILTSLAASCIDHTEAIGQEPSRYWWNN